MTVNVLFEDSFDGHQGNDLYDHEKVLYRVFKIRKQATLIEFLELLSESLVSFINRSLIIIEYRYVSALLLTGYSFLYC